MTNLICSTLTRNCPTFSTRVRGVHLELYFILGFNTMALTTGIGLSLRALSCLFFVLQRPKTHAVIFLSDRRLSWFVNVDITVTGSSKSFWRFFLSRSFKSTFASGVSDRRINSLSFEIKFTASPLTRWLARKDHTLNGLNSIWLSISAYMNLLF